MASALSVCKVLSVSDVNVIDRIANGSFFSQTNSDLEELAKVIIAGSQ